MKTLDALDYACKDAATEWDETDEPVINQEKAEELYEFCSKWFRYGEQVTLEVDTEAGTISVLPAN